MNKARLLRRSHFIYNRGEHKGDASMKKKTKILLASLAANAAVLTDNALSINGNRVSGAEKTVKSWASSVIG